MKNIKRIATTVIATAAVSVGLIAPASAQAQSSIPHVAPVDMSAVQNVVPHAPVKDIENQVNGAIQDANYNITLANQVISDTISNVPNVQQIQADIQNNIQNAIPQIPAGSSVPGVPNAPHNPVVPPVNNTPQDAQLEADTVRHINDHRISRGLHPVVVDPLLTTQARGWAANMRDTDNWGFYPGTSKQAIAITTHAGPATLYNQWKDKNVVNDPTITRIGVGVATSPGGGVTYGHILGA